MTDADQRACRAGEQAEPRNNTLQRKEKIVSPPVQNQVTPHQPPPVLPAVREFDAVQPGLDPYAPVGAGAVDSLATNANTAPPGTVSQRGSYLDRFAKGAISGAVIGALLGLFILVRTFVRKVKAPDKSTPTLTAAAGATPMQMSTDQQNLYPVKRDPNKDHQMNDNQKLLCLGIIAIIVAMAVYPPFQVHWGGITRSVGYDWIFSPPHGAATIDVAMLIAQWVIVLGIGAIAYILLRNRS
jgi:hypothetical protein